MIHIAEKRSIVSKSLAGKKVNNDKKKNPKSARFRWGRFFKWVAIPVLTVGILAFTFAALLFASYVATSPKLEMSRLESYPNTQILDKNGGLVAQLGQEKRVLVSTDQIPMTLVNALTSIEDHRFFDHRGVDPIRIAGSLLNNIQGGSLQGGSTLTQELVKLSFFTTSVSDQTLKRKAQEAWMSIELEKKLSKEEIITLYINKVPMSNGGYGMQTAAKTFYGKPLSQLSLPQIALLAGMPQAPADYDPYLHPDKARIRRDQVLQAMYKYGKISKAEETAAIATKVDDGLQPLSQNSSIPHFLNSFITEVLLQVKKDTGKDPATTPMTIYTTLDNNVQMQLDQIFNTNKYVNYPDGQQVAATVVDPKTGAVIAQMGGRDQPDNSYFGDNPAVDTDRDWGSTMKPLTDYAPGLDNGTFKSTAQIFSDAPFDYPGTNNPVYDYDNKYMYNITMRTALWQSRNIPAIKALNQIGLNTSSAFLKNVGIQYFPSEVYSNAFSSSTGSPNGVTADRQYGASSEKMAAAYAAFANGGNYTTPYYVSKVVYSDGVTKDLTPPTNRVMKETTAYMITDMLKGVIPYGTNGSTFPPNKLIGLHQAGKTGTSNYTDQQLSLVKATSEFIVPDETWVGYTKDYSMAVWTGFTDRLYPVQDINVPSAVYTAMMQYLYPNTSTNTDWTMPSGLTRYGTELYQDGAVPSYSAPPVIPSPSSSISDSSSQNNTSDSSSSAPSSASPDTTPNGPDAGAPSASSSSTTVSQ